METILTPYSNSEKASRILNEGSSKGRKRQSNIAEEILMGSVNMMLAVENLELCFPSYLQPGLFPEQKPQTSVRRRAGYGDGTTFTDPPAGWAYARSCSFQSSWQPDFMAHIRKLSANNSVAGQCWGAHRRELGLTRSWTWAFFTDQAREKYENTSARAMG